MQSEIQVAVFEYEEFDRPTRKWRLAAKLGTEAAIRQAGGILVRSSALIVDSARLDEDGFLVKSRFVV